MLHIYYPSSSRNGVALLLSLIYYLTTTKRGHSKNPMSSSALWLTVSRTNHAAKKVLIQDNSWVVCPTRKTSTFIFLQIPNLSFCTVSITVKFIDSHTTKPRKFVLPSLPCSLHRLLWQRGVLIWGWHTSLESILSLRIRGSDGPKQKTVGKEKSVFRYQPQRPTAASGVHRMWSYTLCSKQSGLMGTLAWEDRRPEDEEFTLRISTSTVVTEDPALARPHTYLPPLTRVLGVGWRASAWLALGCNQPWGLLHWILASKLYRKRPFYPHSLAIKHCSNTDMCKTLHFLHHNRTLASGFPGTGCCMPDMVQLSAGRRVSLPGLWRCLSWGPGLASILAVWRNGQTSLWEHWQGQSSHSPGSQPLQKSLYFKQDVPLQIFLAFWAVIHIKDTVPLYYGVYQGPKELPNF